MGWQRQGNNRDTNGRSAKKRHKNYRRHKKPDEEQSEREASVQQVTPGRITSIESQKKNSNRVSVFIDDKFGFGLHHDVLLQHGLHAGQDLDEEQITTLQAADALIRAKETAIVYLGHRARTEQEVRKKLHGKGFESAIIDRVITRLHELSYLDDAGFARSYTQNRFKYKGYGPQRIRVELRRLGIENQLIEAAIEETMPGEAMYDKALAEAQKRLRRLRSEKDMNKKRQKLYGFLMRRGHTPDIVREVIDNIEF